MPPGFPDSRFSSEEIDGERLKLLCSGLREAKAKQADLAAQMEKLGV
jgi:hypothetical protein